jgi:methylated-DNA-[protein]-cysteine S-methyltransferase
MKFNEKIYELCKKIPKGKVSTYKLIGDKLNSKAYRAIGQALKHNKHPNEIPCFKIIKNNGQIGGYSGNNPKNISKKIKLLNKEGIKVKNNKIINFKKVLYKF